mmetsp:Transcript_88126/g.247871  ORF Transcript_88126/g.247871 Transcript_88126/m.247871 type:complete len:362 (+) Transcript_88126:85-1170(+)
MSGNPFEEDVSVLHRSLSAAQAQRAVLSSLISASPPHGSIERPLSRLSWDPDGPNCSCCGDAFGLTRRRHHCRVCGKCVCNACSKNRVAYSQDRGCGDQLLVRACARCVAIVGKEAELASSVSVARIRLCGLLVGGGSSSATAPSLDEDAIASIKALSDMIAPLEAQHRQTQQCVETLRAEVEQSTKESNRARDFLKTLRMRLRALPGQPPPTPSTPSGPSGSEPSSLRESIAACDAQVAALEKAAGVPRVLSVSASELSDDDHANGDSINGDGSKGNPINDAMALSREDWERNAKTCSACGKSLGKRKLALRHHCRVCGKCVCGACSPSFVQLEDWPAPQRTCTPCVINAFGNVSWGHGK